MVAVLLGAQDPTVAQTVPRTIFVGDRAVLIVPVTGFPGQGDTELSPEQIPYSSDMDIHRIAIERRPGGSRLAVEFAAFAPGVLELPPIEIAGEVFAGLTVEISSVLGPSEPPILAPPALPLAVPGTALLVYGTIAGLVLALLVVSMVSLKGQLWLKGLLATWKRRRMLGAMLGAERRLRKALAKGVAPREILDALSGEFRGFLSGFTGENCLAMTAPEIAGLGFPGIPGFQSSGSPEAPRIPGSPEIPGTSRIPGSQSTGSPDGEFLGRFFDRCDGIRFSGQAIGGDEALEIIDDLRGFLLALKSTLNRPPVPAGEPEQTEMVSAA